MAQEKLWTGSLTVWTAREKLWTGSLTVRTAREKLRTGSLTIRTAQEKLQAGSLTVQTARKTFRTGNGTVRTAHKRISNGWSKCLNSSWNLQTSSHERIINLMIIIRLVISNGAVPLHISLKNNFERMAFNHWKCSCYYFISPLKAKESKLGTSCCIRKQATSCGFSIKSLNLVEVILGKSFRSQINMIYHSVDFIQQVSFTGHRSQVTGHQKICQNAMKQMHTSAS